MAGSLQAAASGRFWGLRGGGGNFGIVTSFEYRLHPVGPVLAGPVVHPFTAAREVARFYREYASSAPDEVFTELAFGALPDGQRAAFLFVVYEGPLEHWPWEDGLDELFRRTLHDPLPAAT